MLTDIKQEVHRSVGTSASYFLTGEADFGINFAGAENPEIIFKSIHVES